MRYYNKPLFLIIGMANQPTEKKLSTSGGRKRRIDTARGLILDPAKLTEVRDRFHNLKARRVWEERWNIPRDGWTSPYHVIKTVLAYIDRRSSSLSTRKVVLYSFHCFCNLHEIENPDEIMKMTPKGYAELVNAFGKDLYQRSGSKTSANIAMQWAAWVYEKVMEKEIKYLPYRIQARTRERKRYVPSRKQVYEFASCAGSNLLYKTKYRAAILMIQSGGFRNSTLRSLLWRDLMGASESKLFDMELKNELDNKEIDCLMVPVYPEMKKIDPAGCKNDIPYYTFISKDATAAIRQYRKVHEEFFGREVDPAEPIFCSDFRLGNNIQHAGKALSSTSLVDAVHEAAYAAGIQSWEHITPHQSLRPAFDECLMGARMDGTTMDKAYQEFLMGHILDGSQENYFNEQAIEKMRSEYMKVDFSPSGDIRLSKPVEKLFTEMQEEIDRLKNQLAGQGKQVTPEVEDMIKREVERILGVKKK